MTHQLSIAKETEDSYKKSLKALEEVTAKMEREKLQQQTHEVKISIEWGGCRVHYCMVVELATSYKISAYHHSSCEFEPVSW